MFKNIYTINDAKIWAQSQLIETSLLNYKNEIVWFLCDVLKCNNTYLALNKNNPISKSQKDLFIKYILERQSGKPFQYIIKCATFYGRDFIVNPNVLIPRPETEIIIDSIIKCKSIDSLLEVGTGSGCIGITASLETKIKNICLTDISQSALNVAKTNANKYNISNITFLKHDIINDQMIQGDFDIIIANPPYISEKEYSELNESVKKYEPKQALTDNSDGFLFYKVFANIASKYMKKNASMILEFGGNNQLAEIKTIFSNFNYSIKNDLQGDARIIVIKL